MLGSCSATQGWALLCRAVWDQTAKSSASVVSRGLSDVSSFWTDSLDPVSPPCTTSKVQCACNAVLQQLAGPCGQTSRQDGLQAGPTGSNFRPLVLQQCIQQQQNAVPQHAQANARCSQSCVHLPSSRLQQRQLPLSAHCWQSKYQQQGHSEFQQHHKRLMQQPYQEVQQRCYHQGQHIPGSKAQQGQAAAQQQQPQPKKQTPGASWTSLPNLLSLSRVASGPLVAWLIATQQWPLAVGLTAIAGVTDWLDGHLARQMGHTSKLGSYLDPLADKILIGSVVGTMGYLGMLPSWLAVIVVGRDVAQVSVMVWYRLKTFGGAWPGAATFFDVDGTASAVGHFTKTSTTQSADSSATTATSPGLSPTSGTGLPQMKPLMVSKVNTALIFVLVAGCMGHQWQGVPGQDVLDILEYSIAGMTAVSAVAYVKLYREGKLLPAAGLPVHGQRK